jgi:hypothetical protein
MYRPPKTAHQSLLLSVQLLLLLLLLLCLKTLSM